MTKIYVDMFRNLKHYVVISSVSKISEPRKVVVNKNGSTKCAVVYTADDDLNILSDDFRVDNLINSGVELKEVNPSVLSVSDDNISDVFSSISDDINNNNNSNS